MDRATDADALGGRFLTRGHRHAQAVIARAIRVEQPAHALLFEGPRSVGKTTLAYDLAAGLLCLAHDPASRPCRACAACRKVDSDNHPDIHVVEPEGAGEQIRIAQIQRLISQLALTAMEGRFRVAIIKSAQRMNPDAQNALLKTLEEPGPSTCIVLCADDAAPLLPTVVSRSARLRLAPLRPPDLAAWLVSDGVAEPAQAKKLAVAAGGRPGLAITLAAQPDALLARARIGRTLLDLLAADRRDRLAAANDLIGDGATVAAAVRGELSPTVKRLQPMERRRAVLTVLDTWRDVGRDLAIAAFGEGADVRDLDLLDELLAAASSVQPAELRHFLDRVDRLALAIESYASPELILDSLLLDWPRPAVPARTAA